MGFCLNVFRYVNSLNTVVVVNFSYHVINMLLDNIRRRMLNIEPNLAYFSEVRWLSKDNMLRRFYELRKVALFLKNKGRPMAEKEDESWLCDLAFLVDITTRMNELNTRLQRSPVCE